MKPEVAQFVEEMLRRIRREFFTPGFPDKRYWQERPLLIQAITWPARWMNDRGTKAPASVYQRILDTVIRAILKKGRTAGVRSFGRYFLFSVQQHMNHHGDQYYYMAKAARPISDVLPAVTRHVRPGRAPGSVTETLAQLNQVLRSRGGRRRRDSVLAESQIELVSLSPSRPDKRRQSTKAKL